VHEHCGGCPRARRPVLGTSARASGTRVPRYHIRVVYTEPASTTN
jgi:hypothetical protein